MMVPLASHVLPCSLVLSCLVMPCAPTLSIHDRYTNRQTEKQTNRKTEKQKNRKTDKQTNRQTDRQTDE